MTLSDHMRGHLVTFAFREAGADASLEAMLAICYVIRNRVKMQWEDGNWIRVIERAHLHGAHEGSPEVELDPESRQFQRLLREVDDIFYGGGAESFGMAVSKGGGGMSLFDSMCERKHERLYWMHLGRPVRPWFTENIVRDPKNHPQRSALGTILFYE